MHTRIRTQITHVDILSPSLFVSVHLFQGFPGLDGSPGVPGRSGAVGLPVRMKHEQYN